MNVHCIVLELELELKLNRSSLLWLVNIDDAIKPSESDALIDDIEESVLVFCCLLLLNNDMVYPFHLPVLFKNSNLGIDSVTAWLRRLF